MKPSPVPTDEYISNLWKAVKAKQITWEEVRRSQAAIMPLCEPHNKPANVTVGRVPMCEDCIRERRDAR